MKKSRKKKRKPAGERKKITKHSQKTLVRGQ